MPFRFRLREILKLGILLGWKRSGIRNEDFLIQPAAIMYSTFLPQIPHEALPLIRGKIPHLFQNFLEAMLILLRHGTNLGNYP